MDRAWFKLTNSKLGQPSRNIFSGMHLISDSRIHNCILIFFQHETSPGHLPHHSYGFTYKDHSRSLAMGLFERLRENSCHSVTVL